MNEVQFIPLQPQVKCISFEELEREDTAIASVVNVSCVMSMRVDSTADASTGAHTGISAH